MRVNSCNCISCSTLTSGLLLVTCFQIMRAFQVNIIPAHKPYKKQCAGTQAEIQEFVFLKCCAAQRTEFSQKKRFMAMAFQTVKEKERSCSC